MRIHTVKEGDTVFKIARSYAVPPAKIIENNALKNPDRLYPGQKLLILAPTRCHTVRGGDTLNSIAHRFGTDENQLKRNNPSLMGSEKIYPGQILATKYEPSKYGNAVVNGYLSKDCEKERLSLFLPHLTYVTIAAIKWEKQRAFKLFNYENALEISRAAGVLPILRVYTEEGLDEIKKEGFIDSVTSLASDNGFSGIALAARCCYEKEFPSFLKKFKSKLSNSSLELHLELDGNKDETAFSILSEIADVSILNYQSEKGCEDFDSCEGAFLKRYADECRYEKTLFDLFSPIYLGERAVDFREIEKLIISRGIAPDYSEKRKSSSFKLKQYKGGKETEISVVFPTPENTKAKLELLGELGYMGVSFDIMRSSVSSLMAFASLFQSEKACENSSNSCKDKN